MTLQLRLQCLFGFVARMTGAIDALTTSLIALVRDELCSEVFSSSNKCECLSTGR
jgi:hypothetical protein